MTHSLIWDTAGRLGVKYRAMHSLARLHGALGDATKAERYRQDQAFRIYEFVRRGPRTSPSRASASRHVLFATIRGSVPLVSGFEALLAHALQMRGAAATLFSCDGVLHQCDGYKLRDKTAERCARCAGNSQRYAEAFDLHRSPLGAYTSPSDWVECRREAEAIPAADLEAMTRGGIAVGASAAYSVRYNAFTDDIAASEELRTLHREFAATALVLRRAYERLLDDLRPDAIVMLNGMYMTFHILMEMAKQRRIPVYTYERGYRKHSWIFSKDEAAALYPLDRSWSIVREVALTPAEDAELDRYLATREAGCIENVFSLNVNPEERIHQIWQELGLDPARPTVTLFPNSFVDSTTLDFSGAFPTVAEWIDATIRFFAGHPEYQLVLRSHPAEVMDPQSTTSLLAILRETHPALPPNVVYVGPTSKISSYRLLEMSRATLVYLSTIGIESAIKGVPCLLSGKPDYVGRGFTSDMANPAEYGQALGRLGGMAPLAPTTIALARRYAYLKFFRHEYVFPWFNELPGSWTFSDVALESLDDLAPGVDRRLDGLCSAILSGDEVPVWQEAHA